jgi:hypothetical protein
MGSAGHTLRRLAFGLVGAPLAVLQPPDFSILPTAALWPMWGVTLFWVFCESGYLSFFGGEVHGELWSDKQLGTTVAPLRVGLACVVHMCT